MKQSDFKPTAHAEGSPQIAQGAYVRYRDLAGVSNKAELSNQHWSCRNDRQPDTSSTYHAGHK